MADETPTPPVGTIAVVNPVSALARYGPLGIVTGCLLVFFLWGGKVVIERILRHFDVIEVAMKEQSAATGATARGIEGLVVSTQHIQQQLDAQAAEKAKRK